MRVLVLAAAMFTVMCVAQAQSPTLTLTAEQTIALRQAGQHLVGASFADMKRAVDAKVTDVKPFKANAEAIDGWFQDFPLLFPSGTETGGNTKALPSVWSNRAGFDKAAADLRQATQNLARAAGANDPAAFATAFQETGKACGACHRAFHAKVSG
ncbi:MAG: cytochrome c [Acetobacteraceae bacterium]|nr:cytochrome c [Acetobacteraceae bacterium]